MPKSHPHRPDSHRSDSHLPVPAPAGGGAGLAAAAAERVADKVADAVLDLLGHVPPSQQPAATDSAASSRAVQQLIDHAARRAAATAGGLALPPGPLGWLTVLPELVTVWRLQAQLVADIAAAHGQTAALGREQMMWCLFKHTGSQAVRDLVVRAGERWLVRKAGGALLRSAARRIGVQLTQQGVAKAASRWMPVLGAMGVAAYAWHDTRQVGLSAVELFSRQIEPQPAADADADGAGAAHTAR